MDCAEIVLPAQNAIRLVAEEDKKPTRQPHDCLFTNYTQNDIMRMVDQCFLSWNNEEIYRSRLCNPKSTDISKQTEELITNKCQSLVTSLNILELKRSIATYLRTATNVVIDDDSCFFNNVIRSDLIETLCEIRPIWTNIAIKVLSSKRCLAVSNQEKYITRFLFTNERGEKPSRHNWEKQKKETNVTALLNGLILLYVVDNVAASADLHRITPIFVPRTARKGSDMYDTVDGQQTMGKQRSQWGGNTTAGQTGQTGQRDNMSGEKPRTMAELAQRLCRALSHCTSLFSVLATKGLKFLYVEQPFEYSRQLARSVSSDHRDGVKLFKLLLSLLKPDDVSTDDNCISGAIKAMNYNATSWNDRMNNFKELKTLASRLAIGSGLMNGDREATLNALYAIFLDGDGGLQGYTIETIRKFSPFTQLEQTDLVKSQQPKAVCECLSVVCGHVNRYGFNMSPEKLLDDSVCNTDTPYGSYYSCFNDGSIFIVLIRSLMGPGTTTTAAAGHLLVDLRKCCTKFALLGRGPFPEEVEEVAMPRLEEAADIQQCSDKLSPNSLHSRSLEWFDHCATWIQQCSARARVSIASNMLLFVDIMKELRKMCKENKKVSATTLNAILPPNSLLLNDKMFQAAMRDSRCRVLCLVKLVQTLSLIKDQLGMKLADLEEERSVYDKQFVAELTMGNMLLRRFADIETYIASVGIIQRWARRALTPVIQEKPIEEADSPECCTAKEEEKEDHTHQMIVITSFVAACRAKHNIENALGKMKHSKELLRRVVFGCVGRLAANKLRIEQQNMLRLKLVAKGLLARIQLRHLKEVKMEELCNTFICCVNRRIERMAWDELCSTYNVRREQREAVKEMLGNLLDRIEMNDRNEKIIADKHRLLSVQRVLCIWRERCSIRLELKREVQLIVFNIAKRVEITETAKQLVAQLRLSIICHKLYQDVHRANAAIKIQTLCRYKALFGLSNIHAKKVEAAVEIQRISRGWLVRSQFQQLNVARTKLANSRDMMLKEESGSSNDIRRMSIEYHIIQHVSIIRSSTKPAAMQQSISKLLEYIDLVPWCAPLASDSEIIYAIIATLNSLKNNDKVGSKSAQRLSLQCLKLLHYILSQDTIQTAIKDTKETLPLGIRPNVAERRMAFSVTAVDTLLDIGQFYRQHDSEILMWSFKLLAKILKDGGRDAIGLFLGRTTKLRRLQNLRELFTFHLRADRGSRDGLMVQKALRSIEKMLNILEPVAIRYEQKIRRAKTSPNENVDNVQ